jgi:hypothetical protein
VFAIVQVHQDAINCLLNLFSIKGNRRFDVATTEGGNEA